MAPMKGYKRKTGIIRFTFKVDYFSCSVEYRFEMGKRLELLRSMRNLSSPMLKYNVAWTKAERQSVNKDTQVRNS
jgi:hypothetical protein